MTRNYKKTKHKREKPSKISQKDDLNLAYQGLTAADIANRLEKTQISKFHTKGGHGFAAEDANALTDKLHLKNVEMSGRNNTFNGPDRIVDSIPIQTKYYQTANQTIGSAFDSQTGFYRYKNQLLEVPHDQYEDCVKLMREKIGQGKVPGITNPHEAESIIKKGGFTYKQARNIARAGNVDSLLYDAKTQMISTSYTFAISFAIQFASFVWNGQSKEAALKSAIGSAINIGTTSIVTGIITAQILRTRAAATGTVAFRGLVKNVNSAQLGKVAIEKLAAGSLGKAVYGAAAVNHVSKLLRSNVITSAVTTVVTMTPDFYRVAVSKRISWTQFSKNLFVQSSSTAGGVVGWIGGAAVGAAIGSTVPLIGTVVGGVVGGLVGALSAGTATFKGTKYILDQFVEDDAKRMLHFVSEVLEEVAFDFLLSAKETTDLLERIKGKIDTNWLRNMYQAGSTEGSDTAYKAFAYEYFEKICMEIISKRPKIYLPEPDVNQEIDEIVKNILESNELELVLLE